MTIKSFSAVLPTTKKQGDIITVAPFCSGTCPYSIDLYHEIVGQAPEFFMVCYSQYLILISTTDLIRILRMVGIYFHLS